MELEDEEGIRWWVTKELMASTCSAVPWREKGVRLADREGWFRRFASKGVESRNLEKFKQKKHIDIPLVRY